MTAPGTRVHVRPDAVRGARIVLDASETRHVRRVLRLNVGDLVRAMDGLGHEWTVRLTALGARAEGEILEAGAPAEESPLALTLAQGIPKGDKLETIIRMSTELGVASVAPLITTRSIAREEHVRWAVRRARWERVAREASKQCGRAVVPGVAAPAALDPSSDTPEVSPVHPSSEPSPAGISPARTLRCSPSRFASDPAPGPIVARCWPSTWSTSGAASASSDDAESVRIPAKRAMKSITPPTLAPNSESRMPLPAPRAPCVVTPHRRGSSRS